MSTINLHHVDCMEFLRGLPDKHYSLAIVDPPYFKGVGNGQFYGNGKSTISGSGKRRRNYPEIKGWDAGIPDQEYLDELLRVSVHQIIWGINYYPFIHCAGRIVWDKVNDESTFSNCELASCSLIETVKVFRYAWNGMIQGSGPQHREHRIHPTQKPVALYRWLLQNYAKPGDTILDTHGGSMSIAIACDIEGFDLDLCELDKDYFEAGKKRLEQHRSQPRMFAPEPIPVNVQTSIEDAE